MPKAGIFKDDNHSSTVIICDIDTVNVASVGPKTVASSKLHGINGGFFYRGNLLSIAASTGGKSVHNGGDKNAKKRGTMVCYKFSNGSFGVDVPVIGSLSEFTVPEKSTIEWAVGGYSLHLESTDASDAFISKLQKDEQTDNISNVFKGGFSHRSAIGYRRQDGKIVMASFYCSSVLEVRNVMKNAYMCDIAIMLDGGGSSQISGIAIVPGSNKQSVYHGNYSKGSRAIYSMVTVTASTWGDVSLLVNTTTKSYTKSRTC
ncbi:hypothetical protein K493DRAFT_377488 [Basidiobolus meristosporus CBS 931.73]|uniref:Phosphodiester glycosidase domain-containing protein n=1 Tax=Basidiobolus meristosporus CBS 931.73 TaxID=1314790 RepID=A0A1Y1Y268_9FUNG|nr:hypothetical protein K493DRAFT_377488 [Basidiobolus meristosporus CBS 931.73]|eukprot:ORX92090.1 hypothetical protein K493DRAFT_377488 [Basidiobolus meristosporus CBS 931.73]